MEKEKKKKREGKNIQIEGGDLESDIEIVWVNSIVEKIEWKEQDVKEENICREVR